MQKTSLFILLLAIAATRAMAARHCDFKVKLVSPVKGDTITVDNQFSIKARVFNLGPDTLQASDSAKFILSFDGSPILFYVDTVTSFPYITLGGQQLLPHDSADINFGFTIDTGWKGGATNICVAVMPFKASDIVDNDTTNNTDCARIAISNPVGITNIIKTIGCSVTVYPNPAHELVNFALNMAGEANVDLQLFDQMGRLVLQENKGPEGRGAHLISANTSQLPPGLYFYRVIIGDGQVNGTIQLK